MTYFTWDSFSLNFGATSKIDRVSGVVIKICGGYFNILFRLYWLVSPVLTACLMPRGFPAISSISSNGFLKFLSISLSNALRGEM